MFPERAVARVTGSIPGLEQDTQCLISCSDELPGCRGGGVGGDLCELNRFKMRKRNQLFLTATTVDPPSF